MFVFIRHYQVVPDSSIFCVSQVLIDDACYLNVLRVTSEFAKFKVLVES